MSLVDLTNSFISLSDKIKNYSVPDNDQLKLYGYYKQIVFGNCSISPPSAFNLKDFAKYKAWMANLNLNKYEAMQLYIHIAQKYIV